MRARPPPGVRSKLPPIPTMLGPPAQGALQARTQPWGNERGPGWGGGCRTLQLSPSSATDSICAREQAVLHP